MPGIENNVSVRGAKTAELPLPAVEPLDEELQAALDAPHLEQYDLTHEPDGNALDDKALASLKDGESTKLPVKTEFGYHVVHLDIVNPYTPPPFEQVKEGIRRATQVKIAQERMKKLRESAKIEYPAGSAAQATEAPASAK